MWTYIVGFLISTLLLLCANRVRKSQRWFMYLCVLLIPCCIAGFRAQTIGTDVLVYLSPMTEAAIRSDNFFDYLKHSWFLIFRYVYVSDYEIGFTIVVYIVARLCKSIMAVQFVIQGLVVIPILIASKKLMDNKVVWISMLTYYLMIFNITLNMMRQAIGMAFVYLAFSYWVEKKWKSCLLWIIVGSFFHISALLGLGIIFIEWFVNKDSKKPIRLGNFKSAYYTHMFAVMIAGIVCLIGINILALILPYLGLGRYAGYISGDLHFMPNQLIVRLPVFVLLIYSMIKIKGQDDFRFLFTMLFLDLLCAQFTSVNSFGGRIALYFAQFEMITFPKVYIGLKKQKMVLFLITVYMIAYWLYYFVVVAAHGTFPYEFAF